MSIYLAVEQETPSRPAPSEHLFYFKSDGRMYILNSAGSEQLLLSGLNSSDVTGALGYTPVPNSRNVAGHTLTSDVTLSKSDVGLSNVDNTSDATKNSASVFLTNHTFDTANNTLTIGTDLSFASHKITNLLDPVNPQDGATRSYVDNVVSGFLNKITAIVATTAALPAYTYYNGIANDGVGATITASSVGTLTIDTHLTAYLDVILIKDETGGNAPYNGVYQVTTAGATGAAFALQRVTSLDQPSEFAGTDAFISGGLTNLATTWTCVTSLPTVGVTNIVFTQSGASVSYTSGPGILLSGTAFSVDTTLVPVKTDNLSVFAATTSAQLSGVISDETGSGGLVFNNSPTLISPTVSNLTTYNTEGDRALLSLDASSFRQGSWGVTSAGTMYTLLGDFSMMYYTHNVAVDGSGNFLGRDETDGCSLWTYTESNVEKTYWAVPDTIGTVPSWTLKRSFNVSTGDVTYGGNVTASTFIGNSITQSAYDATTNIATTAFVNSHAGLTMATVPLSNITAGTYSFASLGVGASFTYTALGGIITTLTGIPLGGTGYAIGDVVTISSSSNRDSYIRITSISGGGAITGAVILYGGSGYVSGTDVVVHPPSTPFTFVLTGALVGNVTFLVTNGTYLTQSNQWIIANNTTGAYTVTFKVSNAFNTAVGTGVLIPQGVNNSASMLIQTDGVTDVWQVAPTLVGTGATGTWGINIVGNATTATNATNTAITAVTTAATFYPTFVSATTGNLPQDVATTFTFNPNTNALTITGAMSASQFTSTVATGTAPLTVASTTPVANLVSSAAQALNSATTTVNTSSATAPTAGQVLTATSGTAATWQTPGVRVIDKSTADAAITTAGPNDTYNFSVPGGTLSTSNLLRLQLAGRFINNAAGGGSARTITIAVTYGGTTLWSDTSASISSASSFGWDMELTLAANGSTSSQKLTGKIVLGNSTAATTGLNGDLATSADTGSATIVGVNSAIDSTAAQTLAVTITFSGPTIIWTKYYHMLELI